MTAGNIALPTGIDALAALTIPISELSNAGAGLSAPLLYNSDGPLVSSSRLESLTAVTDDMLLNPPADDWLNWRRTRNAYGHSPAKSNRQRKCRRPATRLELVSAPRRKHDDTHRA